MLKGTIQHGQVVTVLTHQPFNRLGIPDDEWPTDPDGIAQLIARMDRVEPFDITPTEEANIEAWRQQVREYTFANQNRATESIFE